jgi:hypothetical protein
MYCRRLAVLAGVLVVTSLAGVRHVQAQAAARSRFHPDSGVPATPVASQLDLLARDRAVRWATAARVVHCGPAPLTERPGIEGEFTRPRILPLESAFADAARLKRSVASLRIQDPR